MSFGVTLLDWDCQAMVGAFQSQGLLAVARRRSRSAGVLDARSLGAVFTWMRPNELVWNYWVNNYLLGKKPPAFDILAWNDDKTNLPGRLHGQFLDIFAGNLLVKPGGLTVLGTPVDLSTIKVDNYVTGGLSDHLTPWDGCYRATQLLPGQSTFVLSPTGHIQTQVSPPGNPKSHYFVGGEPGPDPHEWRAHRRTARRHLVGPLGGVGHRPRRRRETRPHQARQPPPQDPRARPRHLRPRAGLTARAGMVYVALLRGINVGGKTKVAMAALRDVCAGVGCEDVVTYIQSGNVVLKSRLSADKLRAALEANIAAAFGFNPAVMIRTAKEMAAVVDRNPYPEADEKTVHVGFLHAAPDGATKKCLAAIDSGPEELTVVGRHVYLHLPNGMGRANLPGQMERCLRPAPITVRNWRTVTKLVDLSSG